MSFITYNTLKLVGQAYSLRNDRDIEMFNDLWEVYQVGTKYKRDHEAELQRAVSNSYSTLLNIIRTKSSQPNAGNGFKRVGVAHNDKLVIFSDHHMTHRGHRHDYFFAFNFKLYLKVLEHYADHSFALVENGDVEELVIFEPTIAETQRRRALVKKSWIIDDIGEINWDELVGLRVETRRTQLERNLRDNREYYELIKKRFGKGKYYKLSGNHDTFYAAELEGMIESEYWDGVVKDVLLVERKATSASRTDFVIMHGHQFDAACVPPHAKMVGEVISECLAWAFQGADRIWRVSDTRKWNSSPLKVFNNVLSSINSKPITGHPELEVMLESFMSNQVAWEYFENEDPYMAFVKEVCTGDEFFKYRHMDENALANYMLSQKDNLPRFPTLICGHSHEPRDRSKFTNSTTTTPPDTHNPQVFTKYLNTGSAGRFENLIWSVEITGSTAQVYSWSNAGTSNNVVLQKVRWDSNENGLLIGTEVMP